MKKMFLVLNLVILFLLTACITDGADTTYDIVISNELQELGLSSSLKEAKMGDVVTLEFNNNDNLYIKNIYINGELLEGMTFIMPDSDVVITVKFKENNSGVSSQDYLYELFGSDITIYTNDEENPYNIDLNKYGSDINVYFYEPNVSTITDPYNNVNKNKFYENYEPATTYEDSYFRSKHYLMSGDISEQYYMPTEGKIEKDGKAVRITTATYILDTKGAYLAYIPNVIDGENFIIFYGGAYTSLNEVATYLLAFGEVPINQISNKGSSGQRTAISQWGKYGRVNNSYFSGDTSKYPYEPELPKIKTLRYKEMDFGTTGGYTNSNSLGTFYKQTLYNNGSKISRGAARFVYVNDSSITRIDDRYVFYTYNHYNDFQEYLNYYNGWGTRFGNQSAGNEYCGDSSDFYALNCDRPTSYPITLLQKYNEVI